MSDVVLGFQPKANAERDAVHVAVIPMQASELLKLGQRVGVIGKRLAGPVRIATGIVDPFLMTTVQKDEWFWFFLLPGTVTGMRHHWVHPEFVGDNAKAEDLAYAEAWLRAQCEPLGCSFDDLVSDDSELVNGDWVINSRNEDARDHWYEIRDEFWKQHAIYTGKETPERDRGGFSCSC
jgi:hypothetical protein